MNNFSDHSNFDSEMLEGAVIFLVIAAVITLVFTANFHIPNSGQHTGYVTSVEQSGIIWKTWTAYIKTDPQSSQEDSYCVTDPKVVSDLQSAATQRSLITVYYSVPLLTWKWHCGWEQSTIISDSFINTNSRSTTPSSTANSETTDIMASDESKQQSLLPYPYEYGGSVANTGGNWRTTITKAYNTDGYLSPAENYITTSISNGGLLWVSCKEGYQVISALSRTNKVLIPLQGLPTDEVSIDTYALLSDGTYDANKQYNMDIRCRKI